MNGAELILTLGAKVLDGASINQQEAYSLAKTQDSELTLLLAMADRIRRKFTGDRVDLCSIINARSGMCSEDCRYCAQSAHHKAQIQVYGLKSTDEIVDYAKKMEAGGAQRFSLVTSGRGTEGNKDFPRILKIYEHLRKETNLQLCASLGTLTLETAKQLVAAGVNRYHHNIETCRNYYKNICSTHTYDDRIQTIFIAQEAGLSVCSGGIIGMGESLADRVTMAFELKEFKVDSVPLNILNPIPGTPLEHQKPLNPREILKTFALFRFILPDAGIRTAGGREINLRDLQSVALMSGINGMLIGGYLTTGGRECSHDLQMIRDLGLEAKPEALA